jgi:hypothetical protein
MENTVTGPHQHQHQHIALTQVQAGMVLSDELLDTQGHVLLPRGTTLTEDMLASLRRHNIEALPIVHKPSATDVVQTTEQRRKRIDYLFRKSGLDHEAGHATRQLRDLVLRFRRDEEAQQ